MILKIIVYGIIFYGTIYFLKKHFPDGMRGLDLILCIWLFGVYLVLLFMEIRSRFKRVTKQKQLRWAGFRFTFWGGVFWGVFISSPGRGRWFSDFFTFFGTLLSWGGFGIIFGLMGMALTQFMLLTIFKLPDDN